MKSDKTVEQKDTIQPHTNNNSSSSEYLSDKEIHDIMETPNIVIAEALKRQEKARANWAELLVGLQKSFDKLQRTIDDLSPDFNKNSQQLEDISNSFKNEKVLKMQTSKLEDELQKSKSEITELKRQQAIQSSQIRKLKLQRRWLFVASTIELLTIAAGSILPALITI